MYKLFSQKPAHLYMLKFKIQNPICSSIDPNHFGTVIIVLEKFLKPSWQKGCIVFGQFANITITVFWKRRFGLELLVLSET